MIDGSEKRNGSLNFERQSPHVIERRSNRGLTVLRNTRALRLPNCAPFHRLDTMNDTYKYSF